MQSSKSQNLQRKQSNLDPHAPIANAKPLIPRMTNSIYQVPMLTKNKTKSKGKILNNNSTPLRKDQKLHVSSLHPIHTSTRQRCAAIGKRVNSVSSEMNATTRTEVLNLNKIRRLSHLYLETVHRKETSTKKESSIRMSQPLLAL